MIAPGAGVGGAVRGITDALAALARHDTQGAGLPSPRRFFDALGLPFWERIRGAYAGVLPMPNTIIESILAAASGHDEVTPGQIVTCDVDMTVIIDVQFAQLRLADVVAVHDPDKIAIVMDHAVPAPTVRDAVHGTRARAFAREHRIGRFFDIGRHGIVHQVIDEQGMALPGTVLACTDSTPAQGAP